MINMTPQFHCFRVESSGIIAMCINDYPVHFQLQMSADRARELADMLIDAAREVEQREEATSDG